MTAFVPPSPIIIPYCNSGAETSPPLAPSTTVANQETGFPPLQATPLNAGGIPVDIEQFNGLLRFYTNQILALVSGYQFTFDQAFSDKYGGYNAGVILYCASNNSYQVSLVNNNTFNFVSNPSYVDDNVHWISSQHIRNLQSKNISSPSGTVDFASPIDVTGNSEFHSNLTVDGAVVAKNSLQDRNRAGIYFYNADNTHYTQFAANSALASDQGYALPINYPTVSGMSWQSDVSGNTKWDYTPAQLVKGNPAGTAPAAGFIGYEARGFVGSQPIIINTTTTLTTATIICPPGIYNVDAICTLVGINNVPANVKFAISTTSGSYTGNQGDNIIFIALPGSTGLQNNATGSIPGYRYNNNTGSNQNLYLVTESSSSNYQISARISATLVG